MTTVTQVAKSVQQVLSDVAEEAARTSGFVRRTSKLSGAKWAQTLVWGWMAKPDATLADLCDAAAAVGVSITPQGLDARFSAASAECMRQVLEGAVRELIAAEPASVPLLERFTGGVWLQDATVVALPDELEGVWRGCGGRQTHTASALKAVVRLDLSSGSLLGPYLSEGREPERACKLQQELVPEDGLRIADLGFWDLGVMASISQNDGYVLSRFKANTAVYDPDSAQRLELASLLRASEGSVDQWVLMGAHHKLRLRVLAERVPEAVVEVRKREIRREGQKKGRTPSKARLALCEYNVYVTNVPEEKLSFTEALVLARARWQIEVLFRLWKSVGKIDDWRSKKPYRVLTELYAKLTATLLMHWLTLLGCWRAANRSLVKATYTGRKFALLLASKMHCRRQLRDAIQLVERCMSQGCRMHKRRKTPYTYQLLLTPQLVALA
ncbi:MAG: IS4 family transposase [Actinomycetota bacterium]|nr:IS4 family transposase [Actinomycetota bacterium]MDQ3928249.1 IS4 family transposase [Chloroflexota bacterium]